ncbi:MAG: 4-alpha-glucanotransferase, partial [Clostridia bacterium]|nr:4-alpha-glucanotransferase [Clostridia bacterium]
DLLKKSKQKFWQVLPLVQTGYGNSPYSSVSSSSFNPYFISPEALVGEGLLKKSELKNYEDDTPYIDYGKLYNTRYGMLRLAFSRFDKKDGEFNKFVRRGKYRDYALYMAIKAEQGYRGFYDWEYKYKYRDEYALKNFAKKHRDEILFWQWVQFEGSSEWEMVKGYANSKGISVIGDMPLYVAYDSVDVWTNPSVFKLDDNLTPKKVAGVPPDYFSKTGQLWGNPVYDCEALEKNGFGWWVKRFKDSLKIYDYVRIDHFRGFDRYYEIDYGRSNAMDGKWVKVPSDRFFPAVHSKINKSRVIAEDLGIIDDGVRELLKKLGYPGMRILSFAFNGERDNLYLPERVEENSVCYTGTHDNDTLMGLIE